MIEITPYIALDEGEIEEDFIRSSGPGGQNVNKVATAVKLRFDAARSVNLPEEVKKRLRGLAGRLMTKDGVLVIDARRHRYRERNREEALARLVELIRRAAVPPTIRRKTRTPQSVHLRRLENKRRQGAVKSLRKTVRGADE